jgi:hypothetical protein
MIEEIGPSPETAPSPPEAVFANLEHFTFPRGQHFAPELPRCFPKNGLFRGEVEPLKRA